MSELLESALREAISVASSLDADLTFEMRLVLMSQLFLSLHTALALVQGRELDPERIAISHAGIDNSPS